MRRPLRPLTVLPALIILLALAPGLGCEPEYSSPWPGVLEVRMKTVSNEIPFTPLNNFVLTVSEVIAIRDDDVRVIIYPDLQAIERKPTKLNTLDFRAQDSILIIGQTYVPPASYKGIDLLLEPAENVILDGYRFIRVEREADFDPRLRFRSPFDVAEAVTTIITLEVDLDSTLFEKANSYLFTPHYSISSIRQAQ
jgi:hypothetical protein